MENYETFKKMLIKTAPQYVPNKNWELCFSRTIQTNIVKDSVSLIYKRIDTKINPTMYINDIYAFYSNAKNVSIEEVCKKMVKRLMESFNGMPYIQTPTKDVICRTVFCHVVNKAENLELLKNCPYKEFLDLAVIFKVLINIKNDEASTLLITNERAKTYGFAEDELYEMAIKNTKKIFPAEIKPITEILKEIDSLDEYSWNSKEFFTETDSVLIISNKAGQYGSNNILFPEIFKDIAEKLNSDILIIPNSIHGLIAIKSEDKTSISFMREVIQKINKDISPRERLSYNNYLYSRDTEKITIKK